MGIGELFIRQPERWPPLRCPGMEPARGLISWEAFFRWLDSWLKRLERWQLHPLRGCALRAAARWMTDR